jgi:transposase
MANAMLDARQGDGGYRRVELITGQRRRRRWAAEEKARIVAETFEEGANISEVARRHRVVRGLLTVWRRQGVEGGWRQGASGSRSTPCLRWSVKRSEQIPTESRQRRDFLPELHPISNPKTPRIGRGPSSAAPQTGKSTGIYGWPQLRSRVA